jgi:hypothetical protein
MITNPKAGVVMENEGVLNFEAGFIPPKNLQYFLLILNETEIVRGRTKLLKIHSLIEEEGLVKYNLPINTYPLGPADFATFNFCNESGLIEDVLIESVPHDYHEIRMTRIGELFFERFCTPNMDTSDIKKAKQIINKYKGWTNRTILEKVHAIFVDPFNNKIGVETSISETLGRLIIIQSLVEKNIDTGFGEKEMLKGELRHIIEILKALRVVDDPTKICTLIVNINHFLEHLNFNCYRRNAFTTELFDFLDNYAGKERILNSIASSDFSDIPFTERDALFEAILAFEPGHRGGEFCATAIATK